MTENALGAYKQYILPNGQVVYYSDDSHTYIVGGREVQSITSLLAYVYGDTYAKVNPAILKPTAEHGTAVHKEIQENIDLRMLDPEHECKCENAEATHYFTIVEPVWKIQPLMTEKIVVLYDPNGIPFGAGRFDLLCNVNGVKTLVDFKTTSTIHRPLVTGQLNLYRKAGIQSGYFSEEEGVKLGVIHLHGDTSKYAPIETLSSDFYLKFLI